MSRDINIGLHMLALACRWRIGAIMYYAFEMLGNKDGGPPMKATAAGNYGGLKWLSPLIPDLNTSTSWMVHAFITSPRNTGMRLPKEVIV